MEYTRGKNPNSHKRIIDDKVWVEKIKEFDNNKSARTIAKELNVSLFCVRKNFLRFSKNMNHKVYKGQNNSHWKGGRFIDTDSRIWLTTEKYGQILESHYVWFENHPEDDKETMKGYNIHHIDLNPSNNELKNLIKLTIKEHRKIHRGD